MGAIAAPYATPDSPPASAQLVKGLVGTATRLAALIGLIFCGYLAVRQGVSAWYARGNSSEGWEVALRWDPANPKAFDDFGTRVHMYADGGNREKIIGSYEAATRLSPQNAQYWADLGAAYDWAGRQNDALAAFQNAQQLFPNSPDINWRVANFYVRQGKTTEALQTLKRVLLGGSIARNEVFDLAAMATRDNQMILAEALPVQASVFLDYLNFRVQRDDVGAAKEIWHRLLALKLPFSPKDTLPYMDNLIRHRELAELQESWSVLCARFPDEIPSRNPGGNLIMNGNFEHQILNGGLDWRVIPIKGAQVSFDEETRFEAARSLRIDFDGTENPYYWHVLQYLRVQPGAKYHFSGHMRVKGITTDSGPAFEIYDAYDMKKLFLSGDGLIGTSSWSQQQFHFKTAPETDLIVIRVARRPSEKIANKIAGTVWVDNISLRTEN